MEQALKTNSSKNPPVLLAAYAVGFSILHTAANLLGWYYAYPVIDIFMHIGGGIFVAWTLYHYRGRIRGFAGLNPWIQALALVMAAALVGVLWELLEGAVDASRILNVGIPLEHLARGFDAAPFNSRFDTLKDLINDLVGGAIVGIVSLIKRSHD